MFDGFDSDYIVLTEKTCGMLGIYDGIKIYIVCRRFVVLGEILGLILVRILEHLKYVNV